LVYIDEEGDKISLDTKDDFEAVSMVSPTGDNFRLVLTNQKGNSKKIELTVEKYS